MRRISRVIGVLLACWTTSFAEDVMFQEFEVYEFDENRFAPNDTKPTLYKIKLAGKVDALMDRGRRLQLPMADDCALRRNRTREAGPETREPVYAGYWQLDREAARKGGRHPRMVHDHV